MNKDILLSFFSFIIFLTGYTQNTVNTNKQIIYFDKQDRVIEDKDSAYYFSVIEVNDLEMRTTEQYVSGQIRSSSPASVLNKGSLDGLTEKWYVNGTKMFSYANVGDKVEGTYKEWYEDESLKSECFYVNGKLDRAVWYYPNGKIRSKVTFEKEEEKSSQCFLEDGSREFCDRPFLKKGGYLGGNKMLEKYLQLNIIYPVKAQKMRKQGVVYVYFVVEKDGMVKAPFILKGVSDELDAEALRVIKRMPAWEPAIEYGEQVNSFYILPVNFRLH